MVGLVKKKRVSKVTKVSGVTKVSDIEGMLLGLLRGSESDSVRIAAAKVLLERLGSSKKEDNEGRKRQNEERAAAVAEAQALLAEFASAKLAGLDSTRSVDLDGAASATDAP